MKLGVWGPVGKVSWQRQGSAAMHGGTEGYIKRKENCGNKEREKNEQGDYHGEGSVPSEIDIDPNAMSRGVNPRQKYMIRGWFCIRTRHS